MCFNSLMAMLQFGGVLSTVSVRTTSRNSWWISAQHLLYTSSVSANIASPVTAAVNNTKERKIESIESKGQNTILSKSMQKDLISSVFKNLLKNSKAAENSTKEISKEFIPKRLQNELYKKINSANNVNELLDVTQHPNFDKKHASSVIYVLSNWIISGKIKLSEVESDLRYKKVCSFLTNNTEVSNTNLLNMKDDLNKLSTLQGILQIEKAKQQIEQLSLHQTISLLKMFATNQKRPTPILHCLARKLANTNENLNIKQLGDILYGMSVLNYYDELLIQKIVTELQKVILENTNSAVIGSILTSLSLLRFKNEKLLDEISIWIVQHKERLRSQEITSLLLTLATLGYTPKNFSDILEKIVKPLKESDMCQSKEWLDIIWSLTILNQTTSEQYESVLNNDFVNRIIDSSNLRIQTSKILKLLNINAAAKLLMPSYKGPFLLEDSEIFTLSIVRSDKMGLSNSIVSALKMLLPSDSIYFNINVNTKMGFLLDAEFCVDKKGTPVAINLKSDNDKQVFRIGVITCAYTEYCRGVTEVIGPIKFYTKLVKAQGYQVLLVPYSDVNLKDKIVSRVKYINDKIKLILENNSTK